VRIQNITKWGLTIGLAFCLLAIFAGSAHANGGPHGGYTATTDACAGCHRTHTSAAANLLADAVPALCLSCHGASATGADTNVSSGIYEGAGGGFLLGGGFDTYKGAPVTSTHSTDGTWQRMWGSGGASGECDYCHAAANIPIDPSIPKTVEFQHDVDIWGSPNNMNTRVQLTCTNCHDAHGNVNYRILRLAQYCTDAPPDGLGPWDSHSSMFGVNVPCAVRVASNEATTDYTTAQYKSGISDWCSSCHSNYRNKLDIKYPMWGPPFPATFDALDGQGNVTRYRHGIDAEAVLGATKASITTLPVNDLTNNGTTADDQVNCLTCHYAHGSTVNMAGFAANVAPTNDSALLRMDNRGVCQDCHNK